MNKQKPRWWIDSEWIVPYGVDDAVRHGWIIESMDNPTLWLRWGDAESTHEIPIPMKPTTLEACLERYAQVKLGYERDTHGPWAIEKDRIRNVFTEECIPCAILV